VEFLIFVLILTKYSHCQEMQQSMQSPWCFTLTYM
jgi:hypothetical protein